MFRNLGQQLAAAGKKDDAPKTMPPALRGDVYGAIDAARAWLAGGGPAGAAGDGASYAPIVALVRKYVPGAGVGLGAAGDAGGEAAAVVGGVTSLVLALGGWDALAGAVAMRTWVDAAVGAHAGAAPGARRDALARGIVRGVNAGADVGLLPREFAPRVQIVATLKAVSARIYGAGSAEARQGDAVWSAKFM